MASVQQNGHRSQAAAGTLRFQPNVPERVALKFSDGREVEGQYGPQVMFTLTDGRKVYLNPGPAERIRELGLRPGEPFSICKSQDGNRVRWQVERLSHTGNSAPAHGYDAQPEPAYGSNLERQLANSIEHVQRAKANGAANGHGSANGAASAVAAEAATITSMLRLSIDALMEARSYAKRQHGVEIDFSAEDIRTVAATLYIQASRDRGWR